jgi:hypothetical protein
MQLKNALSEIRGGWIMWRKYAKKFFDLTRKNFFVGFEELGLTKKELKILQKDVNEYTGQKRNYEEKLKRTLGTQLMWNIAREILQDVDAGITKLRARFPYTERRTKEDDDYDFKEFEKLPLHERHFLAMFICQGRAVNDNQQWSNSMGLSNQCQIIVLMHQRLRYL